MGKASHVSTPEEGALRAGFHGWQHTETFFAASGSREEEIESDGNRRQGFPTHDAAIEP